MFKLFAHKNEKILLFSFFSLGILILIVSNFHSYLHTEFEQLTKSIISGHLYLSNDYNSYLDSSYYKGFVYWPQGFFPAVLLIPFSFIKPIFHQYFVQIILNLINLFLLYKISLKITKNRLTSFWLCFAYVFSTAYLMIGMYAFSWWFAQVVATSTLLLALYEFLHKRRWCLIGIFLACAIATRFDLVIVIIFFLIIIFTEKKNLKQKINQCLQLIFPIIVGLSLIFVYNFARFGSVFEFGYKYHIPFSADSSAFLKQFGSWNLTYFPTNLYYLLIRSPDAVFINNTKYLTFPFIKTDLWGMSFLFTSPIFLWCIKAKLKEKLVKPAIITTVLLLFFILGYFGIGASQYGFRYALDFYPFLFIILCLAFKSGMSNFVKSFIVISFFFNLYMIFGLIGVF
jgi:hypothetical protein